MRYAPDRETLAATLSDGAVLLQLRTKRYFSLNETGTRIWELVQQQRDVDDIIAELAREFDASPTQIRSEVGSLLRELMDAQLIVPVDG